jgi:hypothetical protein
VECGKERLVEFGKRGYRCSFHRGGDIFKTTASMDAVKCPRSTHICGGQQERKIREKKKKSTSDNNGNYRGLRKRKPLGRRSFWFGEATESEVHGGGGRDW